MGIILKGGDRLPAVEMAVVVDPPADPDQYVQPLASAANAALAACRELVRGGEGFGTGSELNFTLDGSRLTGTGRQASSRELDRCLLQAMTGSELKVLGSKKRRITVFMRKAAPDPGAT